MGDTCQASPDLRKSGFRQDRENGGHRNERDKRALLDKTGEHCNKAGEAAVAGELRAKEGGRRKAKTPLSENQIKIKGDSQKGELAAKPTGERRAERKDEKMKESKEDFKDMTPEGQVLIVRHKLEKIIHGREKEENKAINLLKLLDRINLTKSLIEATKIDLTLEAMNFTIKNPAIKERSKNLLRKIKRSVGSKPPIKINSTEWRDPVEQAPEDKEDANNEPVFSKLDFWMNKLMDTGKSLEVLDKQMENFSATVKKALPPPSKPAKSRSKSPTIDELLDTKNNNNKEVEGDLDALSMGLDKMLLEDKRKEEAALKEKKKEEMAKERDISDEIDQICASVTGVSLNSKDTDGKLFSEATVVKTKKENGKNSKENLDGESLIGRIEAGKVKEKLISIKTFLDTTGVGDKESMMKHLEDLHSMTLTFDQLQDTKIGVSLNCLRKETVDSEILVLSKKILRCWKKLIPKVSEKEPLVAVNENSQKKELSAEKKAEDEIRIHFKKMLLVALKENKSLSERSWVNTEELSEAIEKAIFAMFTETNSKYRNQVNSRVYNIKKNLTLQENLLIGNITPEEVAVMSHEEMASENLKKMRAELVKKGFEAVLTTHDPDDMFCTCRICLPPFLHA